MRVALCICLFALACSKERSESTKTSPVVTAPSSSATGDEAERLCGAKSICPNEPVDDEGTQLCASLVRDPICGKPFLALVKCQIAKEKCGADGKTDQTTTLDLCKAEEAALHECDVAKAAATKASAK
jgi:hypothetical protein